MLPSSRSETENQIGLPPSDGDGAWRRRPGFIISLVVHGFAAFFLIFHMSALVPLPRLPIVPIEVVQLADETPPAPAAQNAAPQPLARTTAPQRQALLTPPRAPQAPAIARPAIPNTPAQTPAPDQLARDELETKLQGLAQ